jgi:hypothetical protein
MTYYDDGRMATHTYSLNNVYQYDWEYYYSPYGIEKALKKYYEQLLITIDATTAPNGRMLSMHYQDNTCQTNCFQGEASAAYDPCGNTISLVAQATIHPSYDQSINGPIEIHIPEQGQWELKELLANLTKVNTTLGENGAHVTGGMDTCPLPDECSYDECDPMGRQKVASSYQDYDSLPEWLRSVINNYNRLKDADCDELEKAHQEWYGPKSDWQHHREDMGWDGINHDKDYNDYDPWTRDGWKDSVYKNVDISRLDFGNPPEPWYSSHDDAVRCNTVRVEIATLQTIDCLKRLKGCD